MNSRILEYFLLLVGEVKWQIFLESQLMLNINAEFPIFK